MLNNSRNKLYEEITNKIIVDPIMSALESASLNTQYLQEVNQVINGEIKKQIDHIKFLHSDNKISAIKEIRSITGLGLQEAKYIVEGANLKITQKYEIVYDLVDGIDIEEINEEEEL